MSEGEIWEREKWGKAFHLYTVWGARSRSYAASMMMGSSVKHALNSWMAPSVKYFCPLHALSKLNQNCTAVRQQQRQRRSEGIHRGVAETFAHKEGLRMDRKLGTGGGGTRNACKAPGRAT